MTLTINETSPDEAAVAAKMIEQRQKIKAEEKILADLDAQMSVAVEEREQKRLNEAKAAYEVAKANYDEKARALAARKASEQALRDRWKQGDESVTTEQVRTAELEVERATGIANAAKKPLAAAKAVCDRELTDNMLTRRAIEVFTEHRHRLGIGDYHLTYTKDPTFSPALTPAVVFSQTTSTKNYGKAITSGSVKVKLHGDAVLDPEVVASVFDEYDCDVTLNGDTLHFKECRYDVPHLLYGPDRNELGQWAEDVRKATARKIENLDGYDTGVELADYLSDGGLGGGMFDGDGAIVSYGFDVNGSKAVGTVVLEYVVRARGTADGAAVVKRAAERSSDYCIGVSTNMGKILSAKVTKVETLRNHVSDGFQSINGGINVAGGRSRYQTIHVTIEMHTEFVPLDGEVR